MSSFNCKLCNKMCNSVETLAQHRLSRKHQNKLGIYKLWNTSEPVLTEENPEISTFIEGNPEIVKLDEDLPENQFCSTCKIPLSSPQVADSHYAGKKHARKVLANKVVKIEGCDLCNKAYGSKEQAKSHLQSKKHLKKLQKSEVDEKYLECNLCSKTFMNTTQEADHLDSKKHLKNLELKLKSSPDEKTRIMFDPFPSHFTKLEVFSEIVKHLQALKLIPDVAANTGDLAKLITEEVPQDVFETAISRGVLICFKCYICSKRFSGTPQVNDHLASKKHHQAVQAVMCEAFEGLSTNEIKNEPTNIIDEHVLNVENGKQSPRVDVHIEKQPLIKSENKMVNVQKLLIEVKSKSDGTGDNMHSYMETFLDSLSNTNEEGPDCTIKTGDLTKITDDKNTNKQSTGKQLKGDKNSKSLTDVHNQCAKRKLNEKQNSSTPAKVTRSTIRKT